MIPRIVTNSKGILNRIIFTNRPGIATFGICTNLYSNIPIPRTESPNRVREQKNSIKSGINTNDTSKMIRPWKIAIALICTTSAASAEQVGMTPDAEKWQKIGIENANRDLDKFDAIASALATGSTDHTQLEVQLKLLQGQIKEAADNNRKLIGQIVDVIVRMNGYLEGDSPSVVSKLALKALIWYLDGTRDNKSYYLLDGAQLWSDLRIKILQNYTKDGTQGQAAVTALIDDLLSTQNATIGVRDQLDGFAQIFVQGIKKMHSMTGDIGEHLVELKEIAHQLKVLSDEQSGPFLDNTKALEKTVQDLVMKYAN